MVGEPINDSWPLDTNNSTNSRHVRLWGAVSTDIGLTKKLSEAEIFTRELPNRWTPRQLHSPLDLRSHEAKCPLNAGLTGRGERKEIKASDPHGLGTFVRLPVIQRSMSLCRHSDETISDFNRRDFGAVAAPTRACWASVQP